MCPDYRNLWILDSVSFFLVKFRWIGLSVFLLLLLFYCNKHTQTHMTGRCKECFDIRLVLVQLKYGL